MKSIFSSAVLILGLSLVCRGSVLPQNEPIKPNRPISAPGAIRATSRFGPFKLPSSSVTGTMGMSGMMSQNVKDVSLPSKGCTYTYIKGDMVYMNGTSADRINGAYMHHITLTNEASGKSNEAGGFLKATAQPFYLIGNERLPVTFPNAGVYLPKNANVLLSVLLQNLDLTEKEVYIDMDYDYLPGQPEGYTDIIPVPQDALGMGAMLGTIKQTGVWEKTSSPYTVRQDARILMMYGHVHDGGIQTEIMVNGKVACNSVAYYQDMKVPPNMVTTAPSHGHEKRDGPKSNSHIASFGECQNIGGVKKGDSITTKVYYDFTKRPATPMANGKEDGLMGISMTYLGIPMVKDS